MIFREVRPVSQPGRLLTEPPSFIEQCHGGEDRVHAQGDDERVDFGFGDEGAADQADDDGGQYGQGDGGEHAQGADQANHHSRDDGGACYGEVESAGEHHYGLADGEDADHRGAQEDVADVALGQELRPDRGEDQQQDAKEDDEPVAAKDRSKLLGPVGPGRCLGQLHTIRCGGGCRGLDCHCFAPCLRCSSEAMRARRTASSVASLPLISATTRPSSKTRTRWLIPCSSA